jgi:gliding motility-associated-like protein
VTSTPICIGGNTTFTVAASGDNNLQYQWQIDNSGFVNLTNDATYSGVNTTTLTVTNAPLSIAGKSFRVLVHGDATLDVASAIVQLPIDPQLCNDPPVIIPETLTPNIGGQVSLNLLALISDPDDNLDLTTLEIISQPSSGATAVIDSDYNLIITYTGKPFSGEEKVVIQVCDLLGSCTQQEITINVVGDITVFNAISPNGDDYNTFFVLENIEAIGDTRDNRVTIYNRWGDKVFEIEDYDNATRVFRGLNNNGNELASGVYFYKIEFYPPANGNKKDNKTGYLTLKRN